MKTKLILAALVCLASTPALGQGDGGVAIYSDAALTDAVLSDTSPRIANIYVAQTNSAGTTGIRFRVEASPGFTGVWLGETSPFTIWGTSPMDIALGYNNCQVGNFLILTMSYQLFGTSTCSNLSVAGSGPFPHPWCVTCFASDGPCLPSNSFQVNCALPIAPTTWGSVKALYRD